KGAGRVGQPSHAHPIAENAALDAVGRRLRKTGSSCLRCARRRKARWEALGVVCAEGQNRGAGRRDDKSAEKIFAPTSSGSQVSAQRTGANLGHRLLAHPCPKNAQGWGIAGAGQTLTIAGVRESRAGWL